MLLQKFASDIENAGEFLFEICSLSVYGLAFASQLNIPSPGVTVVIHHPCQTTQYIPAFITSVVLDLRCYSDHDLH
jgi:hypothetical protein